MPSASSKPAAPPWPRRWAVLLACATFPLLWVGGLVTTTDAGMAVPDWPNTFGYNLFLYPISTWLAGPWDIFVEHGHRLFGAAVGLFTIGLLVALWRSEERRWVRRLGLAALALVIFQGALGGMRVVLNEQTLAMLHGCTGPLFFALAVALAVFTSRRWHSAGAAGTANAVHADLVCRLAVLTSTLVYLQIVLGAVLRHVPVVAEPATFVLAVNFHLVTAGILAILATLLALSVLRNFRHVRPLGGLAWMLAGLLFVQLSLGAGTWIVKYSAPLWARPWLPAPLRGAAIVDGGWLQTHVVTAHVAVGSLLLAVSMSLALYSLRLLAAPRPGRNVAIHRLEAAV